MLTLHVDGDIILDSYRHRSAIVFDLDRQRRVAERRRDAAIDAYNLAMRRIIALEDERVQLQADNDRLAGLVDGLSSMYDQEQRRAADLDRRHEILMTKHYDKKQDNRRYKRERAMLAGLLENWFASGWRTMTSVATVVATESWLVEYNANEAPPPVKTGDSAPR